MEGHPGACEVGRSGGRGGASRGISCAEVPRGTGICHIRKATYVLDYFEIEAGIPKEGCDVSWDVGDAPSTAALHVSTAPLRHPLARRQSPPSAPLTPSTPIKPPPPPIALRRTPQALLHVLCPTTQTGLRCPHLRPLMQDGACPRPYPSHATQVIYLDSMSGRVRDSALARRLSVTVVYCLLLAYQLLVALNLLACALVLCAYFQVVGHTGREGRREQHCSTKLRLRMAVCLRPYGSYGQLHLPRVTTELN